MRRRLITKDSDIKMTSRLLGWRVPLIALLKTMKGSEYLSFRHAANALGVSQSSFSTRIRTLEEDLGIRLFDRFSRGERLTEASRYFSSR
ncbi:helix-turn-helix domain-containing protein [Citrobacter youngae]|uniref:helix-turn-helix domain-containing protein n=1 Tax=Citrobacter youngae TaxID=133448 RepID=UPI003CF60007